MKKRISIWLVMVLILSALSTSFAETDYLSYHFFETIKDGVTYRAYGNNEMSLRLYTDGSLVTYGLSFPDEEKDPSNAWRAADDGESILLTIEGQEYCLTKQDGILIFPLPDRGSGFSSGSHRGRGDLAAV